MQPGPYQPFPFIDLHGRAIQGLTPWAALGIIPLVGALLMGICLGRGLRREVIAGIAGTAIVLLSAVAAGPVYVVDAHKAPKPLVEVAQVRRPFEEIRIASFCYAQPSLVFYCQREVVELTSQRDALDFLRNPLRVFLICPADVGQALQALVPQSYVLARHRDFYKGWDVCVLSNRRPEAPSASPRHELVTSVGQRP